MIKYLYIDDRDSESSIQNLKIEGVLSIDQIKPKEKRRDILSILSDYDGLITDQQLDEKGITAEDGSSFFADYRGSSLAIDIRTHESELKIKEGKDICIPVVLFSADPNVPYVINGISDDIIDLTIFKGGSYDSLKKMTPMYQQQLLSLAIGYKRLKSSTNLEELLSIEINDDIDDRFVSEFSRKVNKETVHLQARFILNELIINQGLLIDEDVLASRLGVDKTSEGWNIVLESLEQFNAEYKGVFSEGWTRWWMPMVEKWWYDFIGAENYIRYYSAQERFEIISTKLRTDKLKKVSTSSPFSVNTQYWTVCIFTKEPLDVEDGFLLPNQENLYSWQDPKYVSIDLAVEEDIEVAECEKERFVEYQKLKSNIKK